MGQNKRWRRINFWRAGKVNEGGEKPVRPVRAIKNKDEDERSAKEVKKTATKEKKVRISVEEAEKGEKALSREDKRQYHEAVSEEIVRKERAETLEAAAPAMRRRAGVSTLTRRRRRRRSKRKGGGPMR